MVLETVSTHQRLLTRLREEVPGMLLMAKIWNWFKSDERGQGLAEYGLIIILIAVIVVGAIAVFGDAISGLFGRVADQLSNP